MSTQDVAKFMPILVALKGTKKLAISGCLL